VRRTHSDTQTGRHEQTPTNPGTCVRARRRTQARTLIRARRYTYTRRRAHADHAHSEIPTQAQAQAQANTSAHPRRARLACARARSLSRSDWASRSRRSFRLSYPCATLQRDHTHRNMLQRVCMVTACRPSLPMLRSSSDPSRCWYCSKCFACRASQGYSRLPSVPSSLGFICGPQVLRVL
jgi:hypothetical protein